MDKKIPGRNSRANKSKLSFQEIIARIKKERIEYYDDITSQIDIKSQTILLNIDKYLQLKQENKISADDRSKIIEYRSLILK